MYVLKMIYDFATTDPLANDVDKVILSFGTNDIKNESRGIKYLTGHVFSIVNQVKSAFPGAKVFIQCTLPMKNLYWYTTINFLGFNDILEEVAYKTNCYFIDCFNSFLSRDKMDYEKSFFKDPWHLNYRGIGILCSWLKPIINCDSFDFRVIDHLL